MNANHISGKLIITANEDIPILVAGGTATEQIDMVVRHDEADTAIIHQLCSSEASEALVLAEDTDVFVLLCHFVNSKAIHGTVHMASTKLNPVIDINATVARSSHIMGNLLAGHALTGCDTVAAYFGIGKQKMLKALVTANLDAIGEYQIEGTRSIHTPFY